MSIRDRSDYDFTYINEEQERIEINSKEIENYDKDSIIEIKSFVKVVNHGVSCKMHKQGDKKDTPITLRDLLQTAKESLQP